MSRKIFLHLVILCGILSQEIIGICADEEINETSDFLVRQKRVISYVPGEDISVGITEAPYVAYIRRDNRVICVGNILSSYVVITAAKCVSMEPNFYSVAFSSSRLNEHLRFKDVIEIRRRIGDPYHRDNGVGLVIVASMFVFTVHCNLIQIYTGSLLPGTVGKIHGWGYNNRGINRGTVNPAKLRSIEVPIISHETCVNRYRPHLEISDKDFCTYHPQRHSGHTDGGAGLVINGSLAGIFLSSGLSGLINPEYPDIFVNLQNSYYNQWLTTNLNSIASHFQHLRYH